MIEFLKTHLCVFSRPWPAQLCTFAVVLLIYNLEIRPVLQAQFEPFPSSPDPSCLATKH